MYKKPNLHLLFEIGVAAKGVHAVIELVSAYFLYFLGSRALLFITRISEGELREDPQDFFIHFFVHQANHLFSAREFVALYLVVGAIINLMLVIALLSNKLKAYPIAIGFLIAFVFYQVYRISITHSLWLTFFTLFDIGIIYLIYIEYQRQKRLRKYRALLSEVAIIEQ